MKRFLATLALTCALSGVTLGADIPTCGMAAPPPSGTQSNPVVTVILTILGVVV